MKKNYNIVSYRASVTRKRREILNNHKSFVLWFTGLSGAGKSTLAHCVEERLFRTNYRTFVLDGDNVRYGLSSNLGFSNEDRTENVRRAGEVAKLLMEAGIITLSAFISPYINDRAMVREMFEPGDFFEIYCKASIETCEARDVKGFYKKARDGSINNFTGLGAPYEEPVKPELVIDTGTMLLEDSVRKIEEFLWQRRLLTKLV